MSHSQLAKLSRTIFAKVLRDLITNKSKAVTAVSEAHQNAKFLIIFISQS